MTLVGEKLFSLVPPRHGCAGVGVNSNSTPLEAKLFYTNYPLNTPWRKTPHTPILPATSSSPSRTLERLFELTQHPSRALDSPRALLPELQRYKDTIRRVVMGMEAPRPFAKATLTILDCDKP